MRSRVLLIPLLLSACASQPVVPPVPATSADPIATLPEAKLDALAMTPDELAACAKSTLDTLELGKRLAEDNAALTRERARLMEMERLIELDRAKVNPRAKKQVDAFNTRIDAFQMALGEFDQRVDRYNAAVQENRTFHTIFNASCAKRPYRVADRDRLPERERKALEEGMKVFGGAAAAPDTAALPAVETRTSQ